MTSLLPSPRSLTSADDHSPLQLSAAQSQLQQHLRRQALIATYLERLDSDQGFWWRATGLPLAALLAHAMYSPESQYQILQFYLCHIVPLLGPRPNEHGHPLAWKSFMTDHFSPVELSWEWGSETQDPMVRFSFEPIGRFAGTPSDPVNENVALSSVLHFQSITPECDLQLFHHFYGTLLSYRIDLKTSNMEEAVHGHRSRMFLAFDLGRNSSVLKAYFLPTFKAAELKKPTTDLVFEAIDALDSCHTSTKAASRALRKFMDATRQTLGLNIEIFAIDCVAHQDARFKIYMRSNSTSWQSVQAVMSMNGLLQDPSLDHGLEDLKKLWKLVLDLDETYQDEVELPVNDHRTAGVLYYYELRPGRSLPAAKVYIPIKHYSKSDMAAIDGLSTYIQGTGRIGIAAKYLDAVEQFA